MVSQQQTEILAAPAPSAGIGLAAGITAGFNAAWYRERVSLMNSALKTFDLADDVLKAVQQAFARVDRFGTFVSPTVARTPSDVQAALARSAADGVMFFSITFGFRSDGAFMFTGWLSLVPTSPALKALRTRPNDANYHDSGNALLEKQSRIERHLLSASDPNRVRAFFAKATAELADWAATEVSSL